MTLTLEPPANWDYTKDAPRYQEFEGIAPQAALQEARALIEHSILNQPRSLQRRIGPSEIGTECTHCLGAKIAGWKKTERDVPWLPFIGTATHAALEEMFIRYENNRNAVHTTGLRYGTEVRTIVGSIDGVQISGSVDLVDYVAGMTVDWKITGATTLRAAKSGPSKVYRTQAHLYAKGLNDAGHRIEHVAIAYLPRNAVTLADAVWWTEPHDRQLAVDALDRANQLAVNIRAMASISEDTATAYISSLPRHDGCTDCAKYPDAPPQTPRDDEFAGIPTK